MLDFGAEKGRLQDQGRRMGSSCSKRPELLDGFQERVFKGKFGREDSRRVTFFSLIAGGWIQGSCGQPEVSILHWVGGFFL